jgi:hypothetical protein
MMPAVLALRASKGSCLLEIVDFLEEVKRPISTVEVILSTLNGRSRQRRKWLVCSHDIRDLAAGVAAYIEGHTKLRGRMDAIVVALDGHSASYSRSDNRRRARPGEASTEGRRADGSRCEGGALSVQE